MNSNKNSKVKMILINLKKFYSKYYLYIYLCTPFLFMDIFVRALGFKVIFFPAYSPVPNIFSILWVMLFVGIATSFNGIVGKIIYWSLFSFYLFMFLTQCIYYNMSSLYFSFNLLKMADEGSSYILDTILGTNPLFYVMAILFVFIAIYIGCQIPKNTGFKRKQFLTIILIFIIGHTITPFLLGPANKSLKWNSFKNPHNIYNSYTDSNKSMRVSGLYEYTVRSFYVSFLKPKEKISTENKKFLEQAYTPTGYEKTVNNYTGLFKGKNVIFLQMEGMDSWLLTKEDTPNLYELREHSINFTNHYSLYTGGGSTFNSEFSVNTGFTTPLSYVENVYSFNTNTFDYTLPKLFKEQGYSVNAFHMNFSDFYSRGVNYQSWGYDNYWGLLDIENYSDKRYILDRELIQNETFYEKMFKQKGKFVNYIITYSPHVPFTTEKEVGKLLAQEKYRGQTIPNLSEEECARMAVSETDNMVGLLIQALKDNNLYDNTVIIAYSDHYLYTIKDKSVLAKYKQTKNNLINNTPLFIWSSDVVPRTINKVTMQTNILPTTLNLFGIKYDKSYFISEDALAPDYDGFAFFPDYSWYDGNVYVENNKVTNKGKISVSELERKCKKIAGIIKKNDLTLKYDFFKLNK